MKPPNRNGGFARGKTAVKIWLAGLPVLKVKLHWLYGAIAAGGITGPVNGGHACEPLKVVWEQFLHKIGCDEIFNLCLRVPKRLFHL